MLLFQAAKPINTQQNTHTNTYLYCKREKRCIFCVSAFPR